MVSSEMKVLAFVATPREPVKAGPAPEENVDVVNRCAVIAVFVRGFGKRRALEAVSCEAMMGALVPRADSLHWSGEVVCADGEAGLPLTRSMPTH
jgi:hypothetical protein